MATIKVKLNTYRPNRSGKYSLVIQLIHRRKRCLLPTGIKIEPEFFDPKRCRIRCLKDSLYSRSETRRMNLLLQEELQIITDKIDRYQTDYTVHEIATWHKRRKDLDNVFSYLELMIEEKERLQRYGTARAYRATFNSLKRFCGGERLSFSEMDYRCLRNYESFLQSQGNTANTVAYYMRNLQTAYNRAQDDHVFPWPKYGSPFRKIRVTSSATIKRALTSEQLKHVASLDLSKNKSLAFTRDMFMASFYLRGIPFVDLIHLTHKNIIGNTICYHRRKTSSRVVVEIIPQLQELIDRYATEGDLLFPFIHNWDHDSQLSYNEYRNALHYYNCNLKEIGKLAGLDIPLTGYVARHSWATCAKNKGISTAIISEGLGHSSERITQVYLKSFDNDVLNEANILVAKL